MPHETQRLSVRLLLQQAGLSGSYGGIKLDTADTAAYLDTVHVLFEPNGFSAIMKMFNHDPDATVASRSFGGVKEWTTRAPMLALSDPDPALGFPMGTRLEPRVLVRNTTANHYTAHIRFNWRSSASTGSSAPFELPLKPYETQLVDVGALQAQKLLPADAHWASVILSAPLHPDDLMAVATSYDESGRYGAQTPFTDQLAPHWEAGKWEVDGTHNSLVTVGNGGSKPVRAQFTIFYNHGSGKYQVEQMLAPDDQMWVDFGRLIRERVPDKDGHTLPPDVTEGAYQVRDLTDIRLGNLYEGKVILDKTNGHASYGCGYCCGVNSVTFTFSPLPVPVGGSNLQQATGTNACTGTKMDITSWFDTWWTDNPSIATANMNRITLAVEINLWLVAFQPGGAAAPAAVCLPRSVGLDR
jgi:hypothetical protein